MRQKCGKNRVQLIVLNWTIGPNFVYYPELRQIASEKPSEISITMGDSSIAMLSLFPTYEYRNR